MPEIFICAYSECANEAEKRTHNMKYCCDECCRLATNKRIMEKYYERKARLKGLPRTCINSTCGTILSRYNPSKFCSSCIRREEDERRAVLLEMMK